MFAALLLALVPLKYTALELHQMILGADRIVAGTIVALDDENYRLRVEYDLLGESAGTEQFVRRFRNWTCAHRWKEYEIGERVLVFGAYGKGAHAATLSILSGGGEGEMPLSGDAAIVRSLRGPPFTMTTLDSAGRTITGAFVPLAELKEAIAAYRRCFVRDGPNVFRTPILAAGVDEVAIEALAARSALLRYLCQRTFAYGSKPVLPAPKGARTDIAAISLSALPFGAKPNAWMRSRWTHLDRLGSALAFCGDADDEGDALIAIASWRDASERLAPASEHVVLAGRDGTVRAIRELRTRRTDLRATVPERDGIAPSIANVGDVDGDGIDEIAIGGRMWADTPSTLRIAFLDRDRNVRESVDLGAQAIVRAASKEIEGDLGRAVARVGDLDGDGMIEVAVASGRGLSSHAKDRRVFMLSIDSKGVVHGVRPIYCPSIPGHRTRFGEDLTGLGDIDGDGVADLAVSDPSGVGVVWILLLARDGGVRAMRISDGEGGFDGFLFGETAFGSCLAPLGDLDRDGVVDLLVGSERHLWCLFLNRDGTVKSHRAIREVDGPFDIGRSVATRIDPARPDVVQVAASGERRTKDGLFEPVVWLFALDREGKIVAE